jgi:hypothetical protein
VEASRVAEEGSAVEAEVFTVAEDTAAAASMVVVVGAADTANHEPR